ncbi:MAG: hypothetical protein N4A76_00990 [Firmicutes bacterium]|jgi:hypothetical protein|nr:hypothetical protein [Bacillota bacterium]
MELFQLKDNVVTFHPQALTLKPFKALWDRDRSKTKKNAIEELSFVYFVMDWKSEFADILDFKTRAEEVRKIVISKEKWELDDKVREACEFYDRLQQTLSMKLLAAARVGIEKIESFLHNVDIEERDRNGKLIHNPTSIQKTINEMGQTVSGLKKLEDIVKKEQAEDSRIRGGGEVGMFEDPDDDLLDTISGS